MKKEKKGLLVKNIGLIKKRTAISNFKKGWDEEKIYGPICLLLILMYVVLYFFNIISLNIFLVAILILIWNFFIYYPFHKTLVSIFTLIITLIPLIVCGFYLLFIGRVSFSSIAYISYFWWLSMIVTLILEFYACRKHKISEIDIFFGACKRKFGSWIIPVLACLSPIVFLAFVSSYFLFGEQHIYLWAIIFVFWVIAGIRVIKYGILR